MSQGADCAQPPLRASVLRGADAQRPQADPLKPPPPHSRRGCAPPPPPRHALCAVNKRTHALCTRLHIRCPYVHCDWESQGTLPWIHGVALACVECCEGADKDAGARHFNRLVFAYLGLCLLLASAAGALYVTRAVWLEALGNLRGRLERRIRRGHGRRTDAEADRVGLMSTGNGSRSTLGASSARTAPPALSGGGAVDEELGDPFDAADDPSGGSGGTGQRGVQMGSGGGGGVFANGAGGSQRTSTGAAVVADAKGLEGHDGLGR